MLYVEIIKIVVLLITIKNKYGQLHGFFKSIS